MTTWYRRDDPGAPEPGDIVVVGNYADAYIGQLVRSRGVRLADGSPTTYLGWIVLSPAGHELSAERVRRPTEAEMAQWVITGGGWWM